MLQRIGMVRLRNIEFPGLPLLGGSVIFFHSFAKFLRGTANLQGHLLQRIGLENDSLGAVSVHLFAHELLYGLIPHVGHLSLRLSDNGAGHRIAVDEGAIFIYEPFPQFVDEDAIVLERLKLSRAHSPRGARDPGAI